MPTITHRDGQAVRLLVCDENGVVIPHVKTINTDAKSLEVWATYEAHPDHKSLWLQDGKPVERDFMLLRIQQHDGSYTYMSRIEYRNYDVVDKFTGEVLHEVRFSSSSADASF